ITADEEHEQIDVVEPPAVTQFDWSTFISDAGFQFQYPSTWQVTDNLSRGQDYELLARIVNPARAGRPETDIPIEQFLIRRMDTTCKESTSSFSCSAAYDSGWVDDVFAPGVIYRTICIPTEGWPIEIYASAFDEPSRVIMDTMIASFEFTRAR
ncbi:MAG: hypothetical protein Q8P93_03835, partial [bacterium]|nr:hypothetical protein [bacterium]